ncbi:hypothetical protein UFOVP830_43 [uncultured Caudovirales phage]|uniref:Uncharacterized protein n=1 Tax=uncultured Caudovirales phage TaxID=2100421 RepID=A0A6J5P591_9CAUD|nr:hypothetical protein UFOVP830_43 [uncultured Caudovirales phage]
MTNYIQPPMEIDYDLGDYYAELAAQDDAEREHIIRTLIADDKRTIAALIDSDSFLDSILRYGFDGYDHMTTTDLRDEMRTRGLR